MSSATPGESKGKAAKSDGRVRFVEAQSERQPGSRVRVSVELAYGSRSHTARVEGIGTDTIELRLAAIAALDSIREVTETPPFRFVGIKRMRAFDADVVLVALMDPEAGGQRYIGAVAVRTTLVAAAAAAVLDATNRVLFRRGAQAEED